MSNFYINVIQRGSQLLVREIENGKRVNRKIKWKPTFFVPTDKDTKWRTLSGDKVSPVQFQDIHKGREFLEQYKEQTHLISGFERYPYVYLAEKYPGIVEWDINKILILTLDIEVACENGFPAIKEAIEPLLCITVKNHSNKAIRVWGIGEYKTNRSDVTYIHCENEIELLKQFLEFWSEIQPDVVTGWNVQFFDIPYLCNRIRNLLGEEAIDKLSPWKIVKEESTRLMGREQQKYNIFGVSMLDYLDLYRKFTYTNQESYRLDYIAEVELGVGKTENPHETFRDWYTNDYQSFVDYNINDVELVDAMEDKMKLIELALTMAYEAKTNYNDVYSQVRMWDVIIYNFLKEKHIVVPMRKSVVGAEKYEGAYVKEPQTGLHNWVMSFDLNSLYPHLIMQYNISPETMAAESNSEVSVDKMLEKSVEIVDDGYTVTPNGARFRKDFQGFLPQLMEKMYDDRVKFKKWSLEAKQRYENNKDKKYLNEISKYNNIQMARKIALNSAYGAIGNQYFRYYDRRMATAVTTSGQLSIRWIENKVNEYLNKILQTTDKDYVIASDTDSIYVTFDELVSKVTPKNPVDFLDKVATEKIEPYITKCFEELAEYVHAYQQKMDMAREVIADKGIWTAKKRYILNVHDSEGVRYAEPQIKVMGIEAVKSSTPAPCREMIKSALKVIINDDERTLNTFIQAFRENFMKLEPEAIAYPRSCNNLRTYSDPSTVYRKGTPMHVKGALVYNFILKRKGLENKYPLIQEGDKIKFIEVRTPNIYQTNVISFMTRLPKEFDLHNMINYDIMFDKSFVDPLTFILDQIDWNVDRSYGTATTLEHLFG
jgi:DNA polymerase elongation subunit (family B)